jgi:signal transduction histidine kinase
MSNSTSASASHVQQVTQRPIPEMPSPVFQQLAQSQLELLAFSLRTGESLDSGKIKTMALYLPQENRHSGQLEFLPAVLYPPPHRDRVFIASDSDSGIAPTLPRVLTKLPGFAHAQSLLPQYPMVASSSSLQQQGSLTSEVTAGVGVVEEVWCHVTTSGTRKQRPRAASLSVPLFFGSQTVGVLLVSPNDAASISSKKAWTLEDREQIARAAQSLSLALSLDQERAAAISSANSARVALSDSLHQLKNPLQALRTYGKLLERRIASDGGDRSPVASSGPSSAPQLLELVRHMMIQSDRVVDRLRPIDTIVDAMNASSSLRRLALSPAREPARPTWKSSWRTPLLPVPRESSRPSSGSNDSGGPPKSYLSTRSGSGRIPPRAEDVSTPLDSFYHNGGLVNPDSLQLEMIFLDEVLDPILSAFKAIALDREISFTVLADDDLPGVCANPSAVQEVVSNILDNAFKYVAVRKAPGFLDNAGGVSNVGQPQFRPLSGPRVVFSMKRNTVDKKHNSRGVVITVEDNGPGIPPTEWERVFERGYRVPLIRDKVDGTGIGLDIVRSLTSRMGGTVRVIEPSVLNGTAMQLKLFSSPPRAPTCDS